MNVVIVWSVEPSGLLEFVTNPETTECMCEVEKYFAEPIVLETFSEQK
jgi:hypothetical protein